MADDNHILGTSSHDIAKSFKLCVGQILWHLARVPCQIKALANVSSWCIKCLILHNASRNTNLVTRLWLFCTWGLQENDSRSTRTFDSPQVLQIYTSIFEGASQKLCICIFSYLQDCKCLLACLKGRQGLGTLQKTQEIACKNIARIMLMALWSL